MCAQMKLEYRTCEVWAYTEIICNVSHKNAFLVIIFALQHEINKNKFFLTYKRHISQHKVTAVLR